MALKNSSSTSAELNLIGQDTQIDGNLKTESSIRIDGFFKGTIICKNTVTIGKSGKIEGDVEATNAILDGQLKGRLIVKEKLVMGADSSLTGELKAKKLTIEEGAVFDGTSTMAGNSSVAPAGDKKETA